ncbi:polysaccharide pyruvyl transferase family protein [Phocaeicola plebeius]|uniref:polysaccharide pyruvyl transferase family protein n=1 Tax=Phocaeicola plebeius TaxID=310297 RepID=UPI0026EE6E44|nr:polysaccharide pyruvyl transferase family protein [Phocaeicola plebeius]
MKVAILTFSKTTNYGAALQCYALSSFIQNAGHEVIIFNAPLDSEEAINVSLIRLICRKVKKTLKKIILSNKQSNSEFVRYSRSEKEKKEDIFWDKQVRLLFESFSQTYLPPFTKELKNEQDFKEQYPQADLYIVGSDQVWNLSITQSQKKIFFFSFLKDEARISYAASFGGSTQWSGTPKETQEINQLLKKFKGISVRENSGISILHDIFHLNGVEVLDPTLLLSSIEYDKLAEKSNLEASQDLYAYKFIINDIWLETLKFISEETESKLRMDCETIQLPNVPFNPALSIEGWLKLIKTAKFVVTDSFHCTVFCILFKKQFIVSPSYSGGEGRMLSFLKKLGLEDRFYYTTKDIRKNAKAWKTPIDYDKVYQKLNYHKEQSRKYLMSYL